VPNSYTGFVEKADHSSRVTTGTIAGNGSLVLKLYYDRTRHTVNFDSNEGSSVGSIAAIKYGATTTEPTIPSRTGYDFSGWYRESALTNPWAFFTDAVIEDMTLFARWSAQTNISYQVEHYQQNIDDHAFTLVSTDTKTGSTDTIATAVPKTYTGFTENTGHGSRVPSGIIQGDGSLVLKLYYDRTLHTLSFDSKDGSSVASISDIKYRAKVSKPTDPTRTGYNFSGWFKDLDLNNSWDFSNDTVIGNRILYANWTARNDIAYKVEYYQQNISDNGYTLESTINKTGTTAANVNAATKSYTGFTQNTTHASRVPSGSILADGSLVLKLYYDRTLHTLSFVSNEGSPITQISNIKYGAKATKPTNPTRAGYDFVNWYQEVGFTNSWAFSTDAVTENRTLFAKWTARTNTVYKVEHYQQNADNNLYTRIATDSLVGTTDTTATAAAKAYTGFTENTGHASRVLSGNIAGDGTLVLKLYYDRTRHTLSFDSNEGSSVGSISSIKYGAKATKPTDPIRTGYDFSGWYKDSGLTSSWNFSTDTITIDRMLYAKWTLQTFTVSFDSNQGSLVSNSTDVPYNTTIVAPTAPTKVGYDFAGWYKDSAITNAWAFSSDVITANTTLYAKWTALTDTVYKVEHYQQNAENSSYTLVATDNSDGTTATTATGVPKTYTGFTENENHASRVATGIIAGDGSLVLKLYYDRTRHTLSFNSNEGSSVGPILNIKYGAKASAPTVPTKVGHDFGGWYKEPALTNSWTFSTDTVTEDTVLYAKWTLSTYAVSFASNEGSAVSAYTAVPYNTTIAEPTAPTKAGYDFSGWYKESGYVNSWTFSSHVITANTTLYAKWTTRTDTAYKVEHYQQNAEDNGYTLESTVNKSGTTATTVTAATKAYTGFTPNTSHASRVPSGTIAGDGSLVLRLYYDRTRHTLSFDSNEGSSVDQVSNIKYGAKANAPAVPTKVGHDFGGWYQDSALTTAWNFSTDAVKENTILYAKWTPSTYAVSFASNEGSAVSSYTAVPYNTTITEPTAPTKAGYDFVGWYKESALTNAWTFSSDVITATTTLYAKWTARNDSVYKVEHYQQNDDDNGYTLFTTERLGGTTDSTATAVPNTYLGFTQNTAHASYLSSGTIAGDGTLVLKLYYDRTRYTLTFDSNQGTRVDPISDIKHGATASEPTAPSKIGYVFVGWYKERAFENSWTFTTDAVTEDRILYAKWEPREDTAYTVYHYQEDVDRPYYAHVESDFLTGTTAATATAIAKTYTGFAENTRHYGRVPSGIITGSGRLVLKLYYDRTRHTLSFDSNEGSSVDSISLIKYGAKATKPTDPTRTGFDFGGWYKESTLTNSWVFTKDTVKEDRALYAKWIPRTFTVSFERNGGSSVSAQTNVLYGTTITEPTAPTKAGYDFDGWYKESGFVNAWTFSTDPITENRTLYAKWTARTDTTYKVERYRQNAENSSYTLFVTNSFEGTTATTVTAMANTYTGFAENTGHGSSVLSGSILGDGSLVLKLYYDRTRHTLSFESNAGSSVGTIASIKYGAKVNAPTVPTKVGYDFGGWYKDSDLTQTWNFSSDTVTEDTMLYAKWTPSTYTVSFESNGGGPVVARTDVPYNTTIAATVAPAKPGYDFVDWYKEPALTNAWNFSSDVVTATMTLYAKWTGKSYTVQLDSQSGSGGSSSVSATFGEAMPTATAPTRADYTFEGYFDAVGGGGTRYYTRSMGSTRTWDKTSSSPTLYAYWERVKVIVYLDGDYYNSGSSIVYATYGSPMPPVSLHTRTGYKFDGYYANRNGGGTKYYNADGTSAKNWDIQTTNSVRLYANWILGTYKVTLDQQEGAGGTTTVTATYNSVMPAATAPTKAGYVFDGYYGSGNGDGIKYYDSKMVPQVRWELAYDSIIFAKWREFEVGDTCPAGGLIFYKKSYKYDGWQYLSAAREGWAGGTTDPFMMWGGYNTTTGATQTDFGSGLSNTNTIVSAVGSGTYAAKACADYSVTVNDTLYDQWYLPSGEELKRLSLNHYTALKLDIHNYYWSSTEKDSKWSYAFPVGPSGLNLNPIERTNTNIRKVRPIRRF